MEEIIKILVGLTILNLSCTLILWTGLLANFIFGKAYKKEFNCGNVLLKGAIIWLFIGFTLICGWTIGNLIIK